MDINNMLSSYSKRVNILGSYYLLSRIVGDRQKYKEFSNEEFYNLMIQTLCFIFDKSLRRESCFRTDIVDFIEEINDVVYKKNFSLEEIEDLSVYITKGLTNNGKAYMFPYYSSEKDSTVQQNIQIVETNIVVSESKERLEYKLTTEGYRLLLSTKEYDELFQIKISQTVARLRLSMDDYDGAKEDIYDIVNSLEIQRQKIDSFVKMIKADISYMIENSYVDVLKQTLETLSEEMDKYDELKQEALLKIQDRESYLEDNDNLIQDKVKDINLKLIKLKEFIDGIDLAKGAASRLITRVNEFEIEHRNMLEHLLRASVLKKFNFKEEILSRLEEDVNNIESIERLYSSLFKPRLNNLFNIGVPYMEQSIIRDKEENKGTVYNEDDYIALENTERAEKLAYYEEIYYSIFKALWNYAKENRRFTLKEFLNHFIREDKPLYLEMTKNSYIFRNAILYFAAIDEGIVSKKILKIIDNSEFTSSFEFQIERMFEKLYMEDRVLLETFKKVEVTRNLEDEFKVKTEINIENLTAKEVSVLNLEFNFII